MPTTSVLAPAQPPTALAHSIDARRRLLRVDGRSVPLTPLELSLLLHLVQHPDVTLSRQQLLHDVLGRAVGADVDTRTVDVHVARLRQKLGPQHCPRIQTVHGVGYRFGSSQRRARS